MAISNNSIDFDFLKSAMLFNDSIVGERAFLKSRNEMAAVQLVMARRAAKESGISEQELTDARNDLGITK